MNRIRPPRRDFVVEYKSPRRRLATSMKPSIWGDVDLKAIAAQSDLDLLPPLQGDSCVIHGEGQCMQLDNALETRETQLSANAIDDPLNNGAPTEPLLPEKRPTTHRRQITRRTKPSRHKSVASFFNQTIGTIAHGGADDDLAALEIENAELRTLLKEHIAQENEKLRSMLERFKSKIS